MQGKWSSSIYHPPDDSSWRDRDVFPLPVFEVTDVVNTTLSRTVRRRLLKKQWRLKRVNHAILALNSLFSGEPFDSPCKVCSSLDALPLVKADALRRIFEAVNSLGDCPPDASCQGAIDALRATSTAYCEPEPGVGDVVAMKLSAMSLPSGLGDGVDMLATFESPTREVVENFEDQMLQDASEWSHICETAASLKPYNDPSLHCRRQYVKFLGRLFDSGVLGFTEHCRGRVGAFCVSKKPKVVSGVRHERQRLVLDCRQTNLQFRPPPLTELGSLSSIAEMYLPEGKNLWMAGADIRDCFYAVNLPKGMENFFCLKSDVTRAEMHHITKGRFSIEFFGNTIIPCVKVLPMGFNWSFYLVQKLHEQLARNSLGIPRSSVFLDGHPPPMLQGEDVGTMPYCDNVHVLSLQQDACQTGKDEVCSSLELAGFDLHEHEDATTLFPTLGGIVDGKAGEVRATPKRMWTLIFIFNFMAHAVIDADFVQRVLGHAMVVCTLNRGGMSIFRRLYDFVAKGGPPRRLNGGERRECLVFAGLVPMLVAHLRTPWSSTITCTDASPAGFGICETEQSPEMVEALGRWQERWRFKRLPPEQWAPRQRYAGLNPLGDVRTVVDSSGQFDWANQFYEDGDFPEVGVGLMVSDNWKTVAMGKWSHTDEHITLKEARALLLAVRRISRASRHRGRRHVILVDNLALAFAVAKGRSQSFPILRVLQKIHAISLAAGIIVRIRWVPSEHNVSDGPSRGQIQPGPYIASFGRNGYEEEGASEDARVSKESRQKSAAKADEEFGTCSSEAEHWEEQEGSDQGRTEKDAESHFGCEWKATKNASVCAGADGGARKNQLTLLEAKSISKEVEHQYKGYYQQFLDFCKENGLRCPPAKETDANLADYMDILYLDGHGANQGEKTIAAVEFHCIKLKGTLVRSRRALRGWRKVVPAQSRLPLPKPVAFGMAMQMVCLGHREMALATLISFDAYLRPGECSDLLAKNVVPPVKRAGPQYQYYTLVVRDIEDGKPDKVGVFDNSIPLNHPQHQWLGEFLHQLARTRSVQSQKLFSFKMEEFKKIFTQIGAKMGLDTVHPYQLRHGGASEDLCAGTRDHNTVKSRGRWKTDQSVRRYAKVGRVQQLLAKLSPDHQEYCLWAVSNMERVFRGVCHPKLLQ